MNKNASLALASAAALIALGFAGWWFTRSEPPAAPAAVPAPVPAGAASSAPIGAGASPRSEPTTGAASATALTPEQVREKFAAAIAAGPSATPASGAMLPKPGESPVDYLQRLDNEARKQSQSIKSPFGGASAPAR